MFNIRTVIASLALLGLVSCEKPVNTVEGPKVDPKLVVSCFISPQGGRIDLYLSKSIPVFGVQSTDPPPPIENATVIISDGVNSAHLPYTPIGDRYSISANLFPVVAGKTYSLKVSAPGFKEVTAECTVPEAGFKGLSVSVDSSMSTGNPWQPAQRQYHIKVNWTDMSGQKNYYRTTADIEWQLVDTNGNYSSAESDLNMVSGYNENHAGVIDDKDRDGNSFTVEGIAFLSNTLNPTTIAIGQHITVYMLSTDEHYFKYHESISRYQGDNPFAEPVLTYNNIKNGLGIFAAYNEETKEIDL
jgi:hypothetical protein